MEMLSESVEFKDGLDLAGFEVKHPTFGIGTIVSNVANRMEVKFQNNETNSDTSSSDDDADNSEILNQLHEYKNKEKELQKNINKVTSKKEEID